MLAISKTYITTIIIGRIAEYWFSSKNVQVKQPNLPCPAQGISATHSIFQTNQKVYTGC